MCTTEQTKTHRWEKSHLGVAPFTLAGVHDLGKVKASCDFCGTPIRWEFWIKDSTDRTFKVGSDCVHHLRDERIAKQVDRIVKDRVNAEAKKRRDAKKAERLAKAREEAERNRPIIEARIAQQARDARQLARSHRRNALVADLSLIKRAIPLRHKADFIHNVVLKALSTSQCLTQRQFDVLERIVTQHEAVASGKAINEFWGTLGKRQTVEVTKINTIQFEKWDGFGTIHVLRTAEGHLIKTFGVCDLKVGETATIKATPKKHDTFRDEKQTIVTRIAKV